MPTIRIECIDAEVKEQTEQAGMVFVGSGDIGGSMKFRITRTSSYLSKGQPCGGSFKEGDLWFIEVQTIDDLMELVKAQDELIVSLRDGIPALEIYDDYRE